MGWDPFVLYMFHLESGYLYGRKGGLQYFKFDYAYFLYFILDLFGL